MIYNQNLEKVVLADQQSSIPLKTQPIPTQSLLSTLTLQQSLQSHKLRTFNKIKSSVRNLCNRRKKNLISKKSINKCWNNDKLNGKQSNKNN